MCERLIYADPDRKNSGVCSNLFLGYGNNNIRCLDKTADIHCPKETCRGVPTKECIDVVNPYGAY